MGNKRIHENIDITGQKFGRLTAIKKIRYSSWLLRCDCGKEIILPYSSLQYVKSCGCLRDECKKAFGKSAKKHGACGTVLYIRYCQMKQRCYNPNHAEYHRYGGRGIKICDEWRNSFESFKDWAYKNGFDESKDHFQCSLDRIDNDGDYEPSNCRFTDQRQQTLNRADTVVCEYMGNQYSALGFAKTFGVTSPTFVLKRLKKGISPDAILDEWNKSQNTPSYLMTIEEASIKYGKTEGHIRRMLREGKLKGERINWRWYVNKAQ